MAQKHSLQKANYWASAIRDQEASGLSLKAWCEQYHILPKRIHVWKKILQEDAELAASVDQNLAFVPEIPKEKKIVEVPVSISSRKENKAPAVTLMYHDAIVTVPDGFCTETLQNLMQVLKEL